MPQGKLESKLSISTSTNDQLPEFILTSIEATIKNQESTKVENICKCSLCHHFKMEHHSSIDGNLFSSVSKQSSLWLRKILNGLTEQPTKTLQINLPDILFVVGSNLQVYQSNRKDHRLIKLQNRIRMNNLYSTMLKFRKEYKSLLEQNFNKKILNIDKDFIHINNFDRVLPTYFTDENNSQLLEENKFKFVRYIFHNEKEYDVEQIEEHKILSNQPFCIVKYEKGTCEIFNQIHFEKFIIGNSQLQDVAYLQSYIKYKLEAEAIYFSEFNAQDINQEIDKIAEIEVMILVGIIKKYDELHKDIQTIEELNTELMFSNPKRYVTLMTYKIVYYLSIVSQIYLKQLKVKWIMNDIGYIYLQEIVNCSQADRAHKNMKYNLSMNENNDKNIIKSNNFAELYRTMKRKRDLNRSLIKKAIQGKSSDEIKKILNETFSKERENCSAVETTQANTYTARQRYYQYDFKSNEKGNKQIDTSFCFPKKGNNKQSNLFLTIQSNKMHLRSRKWENPMKEEKNYQIRMSLERKFQCKSSLSDRKKVKKEERFRRSTPHAFF